MELVVTGLDAASTKFLHLWGRYIHGFKPWTHCIQCLKTTDVAAIRPFMKDGTYPLNGIGELFYLCGVGQTVTAEDKKAWWPRRTNVHLAVRARKGCVASIGSVYGVVFTIIDAEQIPIQPLREGFAGRSKEYFRCKNLQFGYQLFDVSEETCRSEAKGEIVTKLRLDYDDISIS